ncbi:hypothetical protein [Bradyrhizobium sp. USDA 4508]
MMLRRLPPPSPRRSIKRDVKKNDMTLERQADYVRRAGRERTRRWRQHVDAGEIVAPTIINADRLDKLVRLQLLKEAETKDRKAIGAAIGRLLDIVDVEELR